MKSISFVLSIVFFVFRVNAQTPTTKDYFQQEVNYKINVSLNDQNHTLKGDINIHYKNNAPVALDTIFMHLWPNAYSSKLTAFAQQQVQNGSSQFYFSKEEDLGNISQLDFKVDGRKVKWQTLNKSTPDIAYIVLNQPLPPNQSIDIQTPFTVKIPASFSRLGHVKTSYQISQWYPKPAVFDQKGWHPMPYLDQGEFFSEFGNFDVTITLPQNYLVAATGELQTASEKEFLAQKVIESQPIINADTLGNHFPPSATETKTIRFKAQKVHDFAWFADKRFLVTKDTLQLPSGKIVDAWAFFPPQGIDNWKNATDYIKRALRSYSNWIGEYPYSHATAVLSALGAGGGMEYPMITVIGKTFSPEGTDIVITHEVGHNWFYGILASNERDYAWMDEGINTFYENRYSTKFYPPEESQKKKISYEKLAYFLKARTHSDIPSITPPDRMSEMDYGIAAYAKPSFDLDMLETLLGRPAFDQIMQKYYQAWKFKHPYPEDFRQILQANTDKNISWFFDALNTTKTMDYTISSVHQDGQTADVTITNKGSLRGPLILFAKKYGQVQDSLVAEGFEGSKTFSFPKLKDGLYDDFEIDPHLKTIDLYPQNNYSPRRPVALKFVGSSEQKDRNLLFISPIYAWNAYDKNMLGIGLYNAGFYTKKLYASVIPMYSFGAKTIVGQGEIRYPFFPQGLFHQIIPQISARRFAYFNNTKDGYSEVYNRIVPAIEFHLRKKNPARNQSRIITLSHELVQSETPFYTNTGEFKYLDKVLHQYSLLQFKAHQKNGIRQQQSWLSLEYSQYGDTPKKYLKLSGFQSFSFNYKAHKSIKIGLHGGYFLMNDARYSTSFNNGLVLGSLAASGTGRDDYRFAQVYMGRNERNVWAQQIYSGDAGMKTPTLDGPFGHSNDWMIGINLLADLPTNGFFFHVSPYFDAAIFAAPESTHSTQLAKMYSAGIQIRGGDVLKINFPVFNSKELNLYLKQRSSGNYLGRITFSINMDKLRPRTIFELDAP